MYKVKVKDRAALDALIESVKDETREWRYNHYDHCFCGRANRLTDGGVTDIIEHDNEWYEGYAALIVDTDRYSCYRNHTREQAVAVLESIRDTGEFEWPKEVVWTEYRRTQKAEMSPWIEGFDMTRVSVSATDKENGSPKMGDMIARNPVNHEDQWLVAKNYFDVNFENVE